MMLNNSFTQKIKELFGADLRSLAIFRIAIALLIILDLMIRVSDLEAFYTDEGLIPRNFLYMEQHYHWYTSIYMLSGSKVFVSVLFLVNGFFVLCLLFGYRTQLMTFACWILMISFYENINMVTIKIISMK